MSKAKLLQKIEVFFIGNITTDFISVISYETTNDKLIIMTEDTIIIEVMLRNILYWFATSSGT